MLMLVGEWSGVCRGRRVLGPEDAGDELCRSFGELSQELLVALPLDAFGELHGRRIESDLSGHVERVAGAHGLRIGADRLRRIARMDGSLHGGLS